MMLQFQYMYRYSPSFLPRKEVFTAFLTIFAVTENWFRFFGLCKIIIIASYCTMALLLSGRATLPLETMIYVLNFVNFNLVTRRP